MIINHYLKARGFILTATLIAGLGLVTHATAEEQRSFLVDLNTRTVTPLGTLGGDNTWAYGINDAGQVVGRSETAEGFTHAFITGPDGVGMRDLGTLKGGHDSIAWSINDSGQVVGGSATPDGRGERAFITGPDGASMRDLGTLGGDNYSGAYDINDAGQVVGDSYTASGQGYRAFITGPNGVGMRDLGTLGGNNTTAYGINETGQVVGGSLTTPSFRAFITGPDGVDIRDLGTLGGSASTAVDINEAGQGVGESIITGEEGMSHAFITGPDGVGMRDLGTLGDDSSSDAEGINDAGQVVGVSRTYSSTTGGWESHAFITGPDGMDMADLNSLVDLPHRVILTHATDINNAGQVIAIGVPEPKTYALMLAGLCLIGFMARRKKMENS
jgi:probable HAF family extracellular repeat protein